MTNRMTNAEIEALCSDIEALIERQRDSRGDMLYRGDSDTELTRALTAIRQLQQPWQGMETVPRDGTRILLALAGEWTGEGYFSESDGTWREPNNHPTDSWGSPLTPTAWMPLPTPPETGQ